MNHYYMVRLTDEVPDDPADREVAEKVSGLIFPDQAGAGTHINISGGSVAAAKPGRAIQLLEWLVGDDAQTMLAAQCRIRCPEIAPRPNSPR
ncbi:MAG: hypothetical protein R3C16_02515 [Hyphomonadaceae bacterium]